MRAIDGVEIEYGDGTIERYDFQDKNAKVKFVEGSGAVVCPCEDNTDYSYTDVTDFEMVVGAARCHGFITFETKGTVTVSGYAATNGDDINEAKDGEIWEFSVWPYNGGSYIIWKSWSD